MQDEIKMEYPLMEEMKRTFAAGRETLQETVNELNSIADKMEGGALLGDAGSAFSGAVRGALLGAVNKLIEKFEELENDIQYAVDQMRAAEEKAKQSFA
jgi:WXG100 family type VII secretion target